MTAQRDALLAARYRGLRTVEIDGRRVTYATDPIARKKQAGILNNILHRNMQHVPLAS